MLLSLCCVCLTSSAQQEGASRPTPAREVTLETLADPASLRRLERPGQVLFEDDFESKDSLEKYFEISGADDGRAKRIDDPKLAHSGRGALQLTAPDRGGKASGAGARGWLGPDGHERVYFRRYIRFDDDYDQGNLNHTGGRLAGTSGRGKWDGMGKAGIKPDGGDRFTSAFEPWRDWGREESPGYMFLYTYWMDMKRDKDGNYWGNMLGTTEDRRIVPRRGGWVCLEQMLQVNTVGKSDGEFAAWIDGELYTHWRGMRWRSSEKLVVKRFSLDVYVHEARKDNTVWYDDVVVSTGYVGPVRKAPSSRGRGRPWRR